MIRAILILLVALVAMSSAQWGYGPGMMGGYGMYPGMMGGYGMGMRPYGMYGGYGGMGMYRPGLLGMLLGKK